MKADGGQPKTWHTCRTTWSSGRCSRQCRSTLSKRRSADMSGLCCFRFHSFGWRRMAGYRSTRKSCERSAFFRDNLLVDAAQLCRLANVVPSFDQASSLFNLSEFPGPSQNIDATRLRPWPKSENKSKLQPWLSY